MDEVRLCRGDLLVINEANCHVRIVLVQLILPRGETFLR